MVARTSKGSVGSIAATGLAPFLTRVGSKVGRKDVLDTDPVADADARVVECEIELEDDSAAELIHLRVEVAIHLQEPG